MTKRLAQCAAILAITLLPAAPAPGELQDPDPAHNDAAGDQAEGRQVRSRDDDPLPRRNRDAADGEVWPWVRTVLALAVVVALVLLAQWLFRGTAGRRGLGRGMFGGRDGPLQVVAQTGLSGRHRLFLVRLGERLVLIGAGPQHLTTLSEVTDPRERDRLLEQLGAAPEGEKQDELPRTDETDGDAREEDAK